MKSKFIFLILFISNMLNAQEFSFSLFFEDSIGNKDTITIGYDENASHGEDLSFGELNIQTLPISKSLEVRAIDYDFDATLDSWEIYLANDPTSFQSKVQIVKSNCTFQGPFPPIGIAIKADHYPLTISWDFTLFDDVCNKKSILTTWHPGGWFDSQFGGEILIELAESTHVDISNNIPTSGYLVNNNTDTVRIFYAGFIPDETINTEDNISLSSNLKIFPNPTRDQISISFENDSPQKTELQLLDFQGITVFKTSKTFAKKETFEIQVQHLPAGIYFFKVIHNNTSSIQKVIIQQ